MDEHQSKLRPGQIQFHQWCEPPIQPGDYAVDVNQSVRELDAFDSEFSFSVAGPRFSLNPSEVYSVYPPKGHIGDFANSLPHIVFTRRTLPWERSVDPGPRRPGDKLPWMALLVFSAADFPGKEFPEIKLLSVGSLINPKPGDPFVGPKLATPNSVDGLAAYEKKEDLCNTIELPWALFRKVAPSKADLAYLAHVREVNTGNKETLSFLADGWFSVVLANRLPEPERKGTTPPRAVESRAYLVSLEGLTDYLPGSASTANKPVRMVVLSSWSFQCREAFAFKASMEKLQVRLLRVPKLGNSAQTEAEKQVNDALGQGFTALNHSTRLGEKAVSWYRGPLVPLLLSKPAKFTFRPAADAALRYSPLDGMMDVSYAAAYQLGRLLALQDRHFATALYAYRSGVRRQINEVLSRKKVESIFGVATSGNENEIMSDYLKNAGSPAAAQVAPGGWKAPGPVIQTEDAQTTGNGLKLTTDFDLTIPQPVCRWLARLVLLYRVPFTNLVADERMLPPDSIRFFYLDPNWLKCLLEGACSVGRSSSRDELVDENLRDKFLDFALEQSLEVRTRTPQAAAGTSNPIAVEQSPAKLPAWPLTGFLLRSPVVAGWQGLEMRAWKDSGATKLLEPLRIDRLAPDIMFCIFNGKADRIEVKQPPEGMHFGASVDGEGFKRFHLRRLNDRSDENDENDGVAPGPGHQLKNTSATNIPMRVQDVKRVVDVSALAQVLKTNLERLNARVLNTEFTSADFGVEMVESPGRVVFDVNNPGGAA
jgi:hypothetical protein